MVMKRNAMRKNLTQSIWKSFGRYIAIVAIIALGASMFVGLLMTKSDMVATGQQFAGTQNMFDMRLMSGYGWDIGQVEAVAQMEGVAQAEALIYQDLIVHLNEDDGESVYRFYAIPETINRIDLRGGRLPKAPNECLADGYHADDSILGTTVTIAENNEESALDAMVYKSYTVVGYCATPLYMDMNRGTTTVGNGSLASYVFVPREAFDVDYCSEIHITVGEEYALYSDAYDDDMEVLAERLEPLLDPLVGQRRIKVKAEAEEAYQEGVAEYREASDEFRKAKWEAERELRKAEQQLLDGETAIAENEQKIADGEQQLKDAKATLAEGEATLKQSREMLDAMKRLGRKQLEKMKKELQAQCDSYSGEIKKLDQEIQSIDARLSQIEGEISPVKAEIDAIDSRIAELNGSIAAAEANIQLYETLKAIATDAATIAELDAKIAALQAQKSVDAALWDQLEAKRAPLAAQVSEPLKEYERLESDRSRLNTQRTIQQVSLDSTQSTLDGLDDSYAALEEELSVMEGELKAGEAELAAGRAQLAQKEKELEEGKQELENAKQELADGWKEYEEGKATAEAEFADGQAKLREASDALADARERIDAMTENTLFLMDRNSNIGYNSLESSSDIVQGVSRVFPAFFLLVAALVCITTMTRMIDEERTQIGTLKALGYTNQEIISKYLIYAGSGAVIGCGLGVLVGSAIFPVILWEAYKIMLFITDGIVLKFNIPLCLAVVGAYTVVMLLVTWYCCRKALQEEPAELIRPKSPDGGKQIFLEKLPFWQNISFLNKVTIRNIFRYRQRLAMMMVGIGGCTALLLTGFGLRDSIVNVVDYQFEEVTTYDMSVNFTGGRTLEQQREFRQDVRAYAENVAFYHQSSLELEFDKQVKEIYLVAGEAEIQNFIDMHTGEENIPMPSVNELVLSVGAAENMGISLGDSVILRNADLQELHVTISGIYDNHVYNYAIICPETIRQQWGEDPEMQMAFIHVKDGQDVHEASAEISGMLDVMNVTISEDLAGMVSNMMQALDLVVVVVVFCAGLLAAIVLYNLTNININERIREIATIKVLGFNAAETAAYVFKENLSLSGIGSLFGLGLGYLLLQFVMSQIKIDMVWFKPLIMPQSYLWAIALTMLAACIVDFIFYFKLEKINMAEALKSVE